MRGKAQPDGRPALLIIETPFLLFATCGSNCTQSRVSRQQQTQKESEKRNKITENGFLKNY